MRNPSGRVLLNRVDWYHLDPVYDADGSLNAAASYPSTPTQAAVPCSLQTDDSQRMVDGQMVVSVLLSGMILLGQPLQVTDSDKFVWVDSGRTHLLFAAIPSNEAGRAAMWSVPFQERAAS